MTPQQISKDVGRGLEIRAQLATLRTELKQIETRLEEAGLSGPQVPLQEADREGKQFIARGTEHAVPVRFESDQLIASFPADGPLHRQLSDIAGDKFFELFKESHKYERATSDGYKFRSLARTLLEPTEFAKLIRSCTARDKSGLARSKTVIAWDDAKPIAHLVP